MFSTTGWKGIFDGIVYSFNRGLYARRATEDVESQQFPEMRRIFALDGVNRARAASPKDRPETVFHSTNDRFLNQFLEYIFLNTVEELVHW